MEQLDRQHPQNMMEFSCLSLDGLDVALPSQVRRWTKGMLEPLLVGRARQLSGGPLLSSSSRLVAAAGGASQQACQGAGQPAGIRASVW